MTEVKGPIQQGVAALKSEYILKKIDNESELAEKKLKLEEDESEPAEKKTRLEETGKPKKQRGQFKNRFKTNRVKTNFFSNPCRCLIDVTPGDPLPKCSNEKCKFSHDVESYMSSKEADIGDTCYVYSIRGHCPRGVTCRFSKNHITEDFRNLRDEQLMDSFNKQGLKTHQFLTMELQNDLKRRNYDFKKAEDILKKLSPNNKPEEEEESGCCDEKESGNEGKIGPCPIEDLIKLKQGEKVKIDWKDKLYLSPLTTLGNLPFRRICKEFGADVTCGEMAMATSILQGLPYEWALTKRHDTEDLFGVQLCGNNPFVMAKAAQLIEEKTDVNFIDINLGCPIDTVYRRGGGSGLLRRFNVLNKVISSMSVLLDIPLTVKTRTGVYADKNVAHKLMPLYCNAGVSLITVHGRSREQRYTRTSDWNYINECASLAAPVPVFGNGDILSSYDYKLAREKYQHVSGVMIGRGALYKPWIFTEIKEERDWDISATERLDILKKYVNYGLEHWGSDSKGVEMTRKFLLEWLSFLYRYIPVALLEKPPQKINERPPKYFGRNDLETLMASPNCSDWIKISEMLLGPVPEDFQFLPKHKANSWSE